MDIFNQDIIRKHIIINPIIHIFYGINFVYIVQYSIHNIIIMPFASLFDRFIYHIHCYDF